MTLLQNIWPWRRKAVPLDILKELSQRLMTATGKVVTVDSAVEVATVFACCRVIGNGIAQVPLKLMRYNPATRTREPATDHPLYDVLAFRPNDWQTSYEYREMLAWHVALTGDHFSFKNVVRGRVVELIPFEPSQVTVERAKDRTLTYKIRGANGEEKPFPAEAIWHVRGPSWDSWRGLNAVKLAREAIGLALAEQEAVGRLHKNGVRTSGVYSVEGTLKDDQYKSLKKWIDENLAGSQNNGSWMLLDRNAKWFPTQMTGIDAQTLESRRFQIEEICRFAGVMPIMVGYSDKATTYASAEQMFLAHLVHTMAPWYTRLEQSINANLLTPADRKAGIYSNFVEEGLLRGSAEATSKVLLAYVNGGVMYPNEARAKLDLNPDPDPASDKLRIPANITGAVPAPQDNSQGDAKQ